jgi:Histidine phosphatase superfamily (branch 2)
MVFAANERGAKRSGLAVKHPLLITVTAVLATVIAARLSAAKPPDTNPPQLKYVVIVSRHGIRTPLWAMGRAEQYMDPASSNRGLRPGYLTPHGRAAIELMGAYYRDWLVSARLISASGCQDAGRVLIWADTYERTLESGRAFSASLLPGCGVKIHALPGAKRDPLFARGKVEDLLQHVLLSMEQAETGKTVPGALDDPADLVLLLVGHDTNLSDISRRLGLSWHLVGYRKNATPPGGALIFSLWRGSGNSGDFVRTEFVAQTVDQMRNLVPLSLSTPPDQQDLSVRGCGPTPPSDGCSWPAFQASLQRKVR